MLKEFAKEYLSWSGNPAVHPAFRKQLTLCGCLQEWNKANAVSGSAASRTRKDLIKYLNDCYGTASTPFGGPFKTYHESRAGLMHLNPMRIAFVKCLATTRKGEEPIFVVDDFGNTVLVNKESE